MKNAEKDLTEKLADSTSDGKKGEWQANLDVSKHAVEKYQKLLEENAQAIDQRRKDLEGIKISSAELDQLREDIKQHEALRAKMFEELEARKREADAPARVERIEPARSPSDETRKPADLPESASPVGAKHASPRREPWDDDRPDNVVSPVGAKHDFVPGIRPAVASNRAAPGSTSVSPRAPAP